MEAVDKNLPTWHNDVCFIATQETTEYMSRRSRVSSSVRTRTNARPNKIAKSDLALAIRAVTSTKDAIAKQCVGMCAKSHTHEWCNDTFVARKILSVEISLMCRLTGQFYSIKCVTCIWWWNALPYAQFLCGFKCAMARRGYLSCWCRIGKVKYSQILMA